MSDQGKEAWEALCPELPPGWCLEEQGPGEWVAYHADVGACTPLDCTRDEAIEQSWQVVGGRRAYAESIAIAKVREAAEAKCGWARITLDMYPDEVTVRIMGRPYSGCHMEHVAPDICTAALRAIEALEAAP